jgi:uncharacterized membrane protein YdjX (TVP38/TMEM64 family)
MWDWLVQSWNWLCQIDVGQIEEWLKQFSSLGPLPGILLTYSEALLPFLPLMAFIIANAAAYGLWLGFLLSWIGIGLGLITLFWIVRSCGAGRLGACVQNKVSGIQHFFHLLETRGFSTIFILFSLPFMPAILVLLAAAMSKIKFWSFIIPALAGRTVLVIMMAYIGDDWQQYVIQPWRIAIVAFIFWLFWFIANKLEKHWGKPDPQKNRVGQVCSKTGKILESSD